jgi:7-methyl-GTP pyrophosphatase
MISNSRPSTAAWNAIEGGSAPDLVLASTSLHRKALLERLGVPFRCRPPRVDEEALKAVADEPFALAERLARAKAASVAALEPSAVVIGGDQLVECEGQVFGKPGSTDRALKQLSMLAGRTHRLITALAVCQRGEMIVHNDVTTLHMRPLAFAEIARYVAADQPLDCAGSYKLEERGIVLFERIDSEDQSAITGMPLIALTTILRRLGMSIP